MSYTKQNWNTGDTITAEKLNHLEGGVEDFVIEVTVDRTQHITTCDKTMAEFVDAYNKGSRVFVHVIDADSNIFGTFPTAIRYETIDGETFLTARFHTAFVSHEGASTITICDINVMLDVYSDSDELEPVVTILEYKVEFTE